VFSWFYETESEDDEDDEDQFLRSIIVFDEFPNLKDTLTNYYAYWGSYT
jgi:hypothetical protein